MIYRRALLVFLAALAPRMLGLSTFVTVDEAMHWQSRVADFAQALAKGHPADTLLTGHPGVTTMWLGTLGLAIERALQQAGLLGQPAYTTHLALLRLPLVLANSLAAAIGFVLLCRLLPRSVALLAALLWATNPFLIAHQRLLHLDGLLASLMTLSLLALQTLNAKPQTPNPKRSNATSHRLSAIGYRLFSLNLNRRTPKPSTEPEPIRMQQFACASTQQQAARQSTARIQSPNPSRLSASGYRLAASGPCLASGALAGLALLTKVPAVLLLPAAALLLVALAPAGRLLPRLRWALPRYGIWLLAALAVAFALWPALWVTPLAAGERLVREAVNNGDSPHGWGNFFWGQAVADPGPFFYPVALALRLSPWATIGLLAAAALARRPGSLVRRHGAVLLPLALVAAAFLLALTLPAKKFDRYMLPVLPLLDVLAAAGLLGLGEALASRYNVHQRTQRRLATLALLPLLGLPLLYQPYELAYANPLLGGGPVAARAIPFGWGEGMDLAAHWLNNQPDLGDGAVASWFEPTLRPFVAGDVFSIGYLRRGRAFNYLVLYVDQVQRRNEPTIIDAYLGVQPPLHTVAIGGIPYAWIYQVPPAFQQTSDAQFAKAVDVRGFTLAGEHRPGGTVELTLGLHADTPLPADTLLFAHLLGPDGRRYGQADAEAADSRFATGGWEPGRTVVRHLQVAIATDAPPGDYQLAIGLYHAADGARLPLTRGTSVVPALAGTDALLLTTVHLP